MDSVSIYFNTLTFTTSNSFDGNLILTWNFNKIMSTVNL